MRSYMTDRKLNIITTILAAILTALVACAVTLDNQKDRAQAVQDYIHGECELVSNRQGEKWYECPYTQ